MATFPKTYVHNSPVYLEYIRSFPCCKCDATIGIEAHHIPSILGIAVLGGNPGGMSAKAPDAHTVPLCRNCHDEHDRVGAETFWKGENVEVIVISYLTRFLIERGL